MAEEPANTLFRPSKRRKIFRKRADEDEDDNTATGRDEAHRIAKAETTPGTMTGDERAGNTTQPRRPGKPRRFGVNFSSASSPRPADQTDKSAMTRVNPVQDAISAAAGRFTAPTGQTVQKEDKHMWVPPLFQQAQDTVTDGPGWHI